MMKAANAAFFLSHCCKLFPLVYTCIQQREAGGDKHWRTLKFLAGPKHEERLFHIHIISYFAPRSQPVWLINSLVCPQFGALSRKCLILVENSVALLNWFAFA